VVEFAVVDTLRTQYRENPSPSSEMEFGGHTDIYTDMDTQITWRSKSLYLNLGIKKEGLKRRFRYFKLFVDSNQVLAKLSVITVI